MAKNQVEYAIDRAIERRDARLDEIKESAPELYDRFQLDEYRSDVKPKIDTYTKIIRIGGIDYTVNEIAELHDGGVDLNGHILYNNAEIQVDAGLSDHRKWIVMWHEVLHGILEQAGMSEHEEQMVVVLGYGVTQVLRDNPYMRGNEHSRTPA